ncbi:hypothetical protein [Clostridium algidicarnis]|uniref:hypothetical protein n=1 Tax=Clostridium algidicarnis TaxID=37659 RepID=UPI001C0AF342|nr:hypothetical protein [Clostridium algidicarnis]MBU3205197.1 hypothetical protein [Clostridium algidicarnis]MBU3223293.1 hypothetical protein [Clostridium algidicarnis]
MQSKRLKQIISITLCTAIISGFGGFNVKANASELKGVDLIYSSAYKATMKAQEDKTQKSINEARLAVDKLKAVLPNSNAIPTWSSLTDKIQHPKLVKMVNSIGKAQKDKTQKSINDARNTIEEELPSKWKNSYSSALDVVQQFKIDEVVKAVEKAKTTKDTKDVAIASDLITEIKTSNKAFISNFGKTMETKLLAPTSTKKPYTGDRPITNRRTDAKYPAGLFSESEINNAINNNTAFIATDTNGINRVNIPIRIEKNSDGSVTVYINENMQPLFDRSMQYYFFISPNRNWCDSLLIG